MQNIGFSRHQSILLATQMNLRKEKVIFFYGIKIDILNNIDKN